MTSVARLLEQAKRKQARDKLVPGRIFHFPTMAFGWPKPKVKAKFVVFLGTVAGQHRVLVINSEPAPFIKANQHLLDDQVPLDKKAHGFLDHDSVVACHQIHDVNPMEVENALVNDMENIKGMISPECRAAIIKAVDASVNLMPIDQEFIKTALK